MNLIKSVKKGVKKVAGSIKKNAVVIAAPVLALDKIGVGPTKGLQQQAGKFGVDVNALTGGKSVEQYLTDKITNISGNKKEAAVTVPNANVPADAAQGALSGTMTGLGVNNKSLGIGAAVVGAIVVLWFVMRGK